MAARLRSLPKLSQRQKLWLGRQLQDACRLAICVLFCERIFTRYNREHDGSLAQALPQLAAQLVAEIIPQQSLKGALLGIRPEDFFFWLRLRRSGSGLIESGSDPMPSPRHRSPRARRLWPDLSRQIQSAPEFTIQLLWHGLPPQFETGILERAARSEWGAERISIFLARHIQSAPTWLRVNDLKQMPQLRQELLGKGFTIQSERGDAIRVSGSPGLYELTAYQGGLFEIQDLASQEIWDACAGFGGKSLHLSAMQNGKGAVYASDLYPKKLMVLKNRARRAGLGNSLRILPWEVETLPDFGKEITLRKGFDRVLVDAPCSGSGTLRRNPDGRLDFAPQRIRQLNALQIQLLCAAADAVRPGGRLVYATCSILCQENEDIVTAFLEKDRRFGLLEQKCYGNPAEDSDSTFAAVMERRSDQSAN